MIAEVALKQNFINKSQYDEAVNACLQKKNRETAIKDYIITRNWISDRNMELVSNISKSLKLMKKDSKFADIAIKMRYINNTVLYLVLNEQKQDIQNKKVPRLIGEMLIEAGMITENQLKSVLKKQKQLNQEILYFTKTTDDKKTGNNKISTETEIKIPQDNEHQEETETEKEEETEKKEETEKEEKTEKEEEKTEYTAVTQEIVNGGMKLEISENGMVALLTKTKSFDANLTTYDLKNILAEKAVKFGLVDDILINRFIQSRGYKTKKFKIAMGVNPVNGRNAKIHYFFDTDYLKIGGMDNNGNIDFKERGEVPLVEENTLLVEKTPLKDNFNGKNIFGEDIIVPSPKDIKIKTKGGTLFSEDGLQLFAAIQGIPKLTWSGSVMVVDEFITKGDVDYSTGHVIYEGNITIQGCIKDGFKVKGYDIRAGEIEGGIVYAEGDLIVSGGINNAKIYTRGNIQAKYVHKSEITCLGNINFINEIVDSNIENSGATIIEKGNIISSNINSKMGVNVKNIDTDTAKSSIITIGHEAFIEKELNSIRELRIYLTEQMELLVEQRKQLFEKNNNIQKSSVIIANKLDKFRSDQRMIESALNTAEPKDSQSVEKLKTRIESLKKSNDKLSDELNNCFNTVEIIENSIEKCELEITEIEDTMDDLLYEEKNFFEWSQANPGNPVLTVRGKLSPGVIIYGPHSKKQFNTPIEHTKIREVMHQTERGDTHIYEIKTDG